jgi:hypothetical protein
MKDLFLRSGPAVFESALCELDIVVGFRLKACFLAAAWVPALLSLAQCCILEAIILLLSIGDRLKVQ